MPPLKIIKIVFHPSNTSFCVELGRSGEYCEDRSTICISYDDSKDENPQINGGGGKFKLNDIKRAAEAARRSVHVLLSIFSPSENSQKITEEEVPQQ